MSLSEEAYGPTPEETFDFPPPDEKQTLPEYVNDIIASSLGTSRPVKSGTMHVAEWTHPVTGQRLELQKLTTQETTKELTYTYILEISGSVMNDLEERYLFREYPFKEDPGPKVGRWTACDGECGNAKENTEGFTQLLRTAHINHTPVAFRHGEPNEKVDSEFWYIVGYDHFAAPELCQKVAELAFTDDTKHQDILWGSLLTEICSGMFALPEDLAKHLLAQRIKRLQAE